MLERGVIELVDTESLAPPEYILRNVERKETIERVFANAKEKHAMRYALYRGLVQVSKWARLEFAAMNLKKLAIWNKRQPLVASSSGLPSVSGALTLPTRAMRKSLPLALKL